MSANYSETANTTPYPLNGGVKPSPTTFTAQPNPELFKLTEENNNLRALLEQEKLKNSHLVDIIGEKNQKIAEYYELLKLSLAKHN